MITEIITAVISGSLALLSDAGHMLSDIGAIAIALWAARLTRRRPQGSWTWGWKRAEIMSAAVNGVTLLVVAILVGIEAVRRLVTPPAVGGGLVMVIAAVASTSRLLGWWHEPIAVVSTSKVPTNIFSLTYSGSSAPWWRAWSL